MRFTLVEDSRQQLISKSKSGADYKGDKSKGRNRYYRRVNTRIDSSVREYNKIDMNKFFKKDILDVNVKVHGEIHKDQPQNDYFVRISFSGVLSKLRDGIEKNNGKFDFRVIVRSLIDCFNKDDVYIFCDCPDWKYRVGYWASVNNIIVGKKERIPSKITNPNDTLGPACKHACQVLTNLQWIYKVAAVINNYTNYMESHYKQAYRGVIYPALYGKDYELSPEEQKNPYFYKTRKNASMGSDTGIVGKANEYGSTRGRFQKGNTQGIRFAKETGEPIVDDDETTN